MSIKKRRYSMLADFQRVHDFLTDTYDKETLNSYLLPQYFEYAHHLQWFDWLQTQGFRLCHTEPAAAENFIQQSVLTMFVIGNCGRRSGLTVSCKKQSFCSGSVFTCRNKSSCNFILDGDKASGGFEYVFLNIFTQELSKPPSRCKP